MDTVQAQRLGASEADLLRDHPTQRAEDLVNAWAYVCEIIAGVIRRVNEWSCWIRCWGMQRPRFARMGSVMNILIVRYRALEAANASFVRIPTPNAVQ